jgi:hypothetical protein
VPGADAGQGAGYSPDDTAIDIVTDTGVDPEPGTDAEEE